jgi:hypothetical protein
MIVDIKINEVPIHVTNLLPQHYLDNVIGSVHAYDSASGILRETP